MAKKIDAPGLPPEMPRAPGNRLAGVPAPEHVVAAEPEIPWMAKARQKWTKARVEKIDARRRARAGNYEVNLHPTYLPPNRPA